MSANNINQAVVAYVEKSAAAMEQAEAYIGEAEAQRTKAAEAAPKIAETLVRTGLLRPTQRDAAMAKLSSHAGALELVDSLVDELVATKTASAQMAAASGATLGDVTTAKTASAAPAEKNSNYIGRRKGYGEKSAADRSYLDALGVAHT